MSPQIACINPCWLHLICLHYVFSNVSSLWEYFDLQGPWQKVLTDLKKSLYTLQADPEKSRDFIIKNPGILINSKSRDPGIPGIPLGPAGHNHICRISTKDWWWTFWIVWHCSSIDQTITLWNLTILIHPIFVCSNFGLHFYIFLYFYAFSDSEV